jgi:small subunit ribosomal protein S15
LQNLTLNGSILVMLTKRKKQNAIKDGKTHDSDTGSPEVQVSILSKRIDELAGHLKKNTKDKHSRRGLLGLVEKRRAHLKYLKKKSGKRYDAIIKKVGLKK